MKTEHFERAKQLDEAIKEINQIITALDALSIYKIEIDICEDDGTKDIVWYLGQQYINKMYEDMINALKLKRIEYQEEFERYVSDPVKM